MAKTKKQLKKFKLNPENFERNLMIVLLVGVVLSTLVLVLRTSLSGRTANIDQPTVVEQEGEQ